MTSEEDIQEKIKEVEVIYKKAMDALKESRKKQLRIIDEYCNKLKEHRLQELRDVISSSEIKPQK